MAKFFGKFRGRVISTVDAQNIGRVVVEVPSALGEATLPAFPCFPPGTFAIPKVGAAVWIEFEEGDPERPVWTGVFYAHAADVPAAGTKLPKDSDGIAIEATTVVVASAAETSITSASLKLNAQEITANDGALEVT